MGYNYRRALTNDEKLQIIKLNSEGYSSAAIGRKINRSSACAHHYLQRLGEGKAMAPEVSSKREILATRPTRETITEDEITAHLATTPNPKLWTIKWLTQTALADDLKMLLIRTIANTPQHEVTHGKGSEIK